MSLAKLLEPLVVHRKIVNDKFINKLIAFISNELSLLDDTELQVMFLVSLDAHIFELSKKCLQYLASVNFGDDMKSNPLIRGAYLNNLDAVKFLLDNGADINYLSYNKTSAIMFAFQQGHVEMVKILYDSGAKIIIGEKQMTSFTPSDDKIKNKILNEVINYLDSKNNELRNKIEFNNW